MSSSSSSSPKNEETQKNKLSSLINPIQQHKGSTIQLLTDKSELKSTNKTIEGPINKQANPAIGPRLDIKRDIIQLLDFITDKRERLKRDETEIYEGTLKEKTIKLSGDLSRSSNLNQNSNSVARAKPSRPGTLNSILASENKLKLELEKDAENEGNRSIKGLAKPIKILSSQPELPSSHLNPIYSIKSKRRSRNMLSIKQEKNEKEPQNSSKKDSDSQSKSILKSSFTKKMFKKAVKSAGNKVIDIFKINKISPTIGGALYQWMTSISYGISISVCIFYALFADDLRILLLPPAFDYYIDLVTSFVMFLFVIEILGSIWLFKGYICSFYFFLDVISTATMVFDVGFFSSNKFLVSDSFDNYSSFFKVAQIFRASRAARLGSKASRMLKVLRMIRLARLASLYKETQKKEKRRFREIFDKKRKLKQLKEGKKAIEDEKAINKQAKYAFSLMNNGGKGRLSQSNQILKRVKMRGSDQFSSPMRSKKSSFLRQRSGLRSGVARTDGNNAFMKSRALNGVFESSQDREPASDQRSSQQSERNLILSRQYGSMRQQQFGLREKRMSKSEHRIRTELNRLGTEQWVKRLGIAVRSAERREQAAGSEGQEDQSIKRLDSMKNWIKDSINNLNKDDDSMMQLSNILIQEKMMSAERGARLGGGREAAGGGGVTSLHKLGRHKSSGIGKEEWGRMSIQAESGLSMSARNSAKLIVPEESRVGKVLIEKNTKILIFMILSMMVIIPILNSKTLHPNPLRCEYDLKLMSHIVNNQKEGHFSRESIKSYFNNLETKYRVMGTPIVHKIIPELPHTRVDTSSLRASDLILCKREYKENHWMILGLNNRRVSVLEAILRIARTLLVMVWLTLGSLFFSNDANELILLPLEKMMALINIIARQPSAAKNYTIIQENSKGKRRDSDIENMNEMKIMRNQILKIGKLLVLVFSNAGSKIITDTITSQYDDVRMQTDGYKTMAIFGFCDVRDFTEMTQVLQEDIMLYVNQIARLVHSHVDKYLGSSNKNLGEAFLLVWMIPDDCIGYHDSNANDIFVMKKRKSSIYAELALTSFVEVIVDLQCSKEIAYFTSLPKVQAVMPDHRLLMGFGLHIGWAIEGAIGSQTKIDASYLSPNVNLSSRLQAATQQFGVNILISDKLHDLFTESSQLYCRMIDRVTVKGSNKALDLYTVNFVENLRRVATEAKKDRRDFKEALSREDLKKRHNKLKVMMQKMVDHNKRDISMIELNPRLGRYLENEEFYLEEYEDGLEYYLSGNWKRAWTVFKDILVERPKDGPTLTLVGYMEKHGLQCPEDWRGFRPLTSK